MMQWLKSLFFRKTVVVVLRHTQPLTWGVEDALEWKRFCETPSGIKLGIVVEDFIFQYGMRHGVQSVVHTKALWGQLARMKPSTQEGLTAHAESAKMETTIQEE